VRLTSLDDIRAAADRLRNVIVRTPLLRCPWDAGDSGLWLKPENLQPVGAFKLRGAYNAIALLGEEARKRGVVAYSSGNHAQAVAYAARELGVTAHVVMPDVSPRIKIEATRGYGAEVTLVPIGARESAAHRIVAERGALLVPPFDHPAVIAGQGTIGLEIAEAMPDVDVVLTPVSGGGLASGIATAVRTLCPQAKVIGVEPALAADTKESLAAGHLVGWPVADRARTIADGLRAEPSELTFAHLSALLHGVVAVTEDEIRSTVAVLARKAHLVAEPSGAVAVAAYLHHADELPAGRTVAVVSGGNIEPALLAELLRT
jgi:threonine dehydratase